MPVVGSALAVLRVRKEVGGYLYLATVKLAKDYKAGCVGIRIGKDRTVVCLAMDVVREMLNNEDFDGRPQGPFYETRTWGVRRGKRRDGTIISRNKLVTLIQLRIGIIVCYSYQYFQIHA